MSNNAKTVLVSAIGFLILLIVLASKVGFITLHLPPINSMTFTAISAANTMLPIHTPTSTKTPLQNELTTTPSTVTPNASNTTIMPTPTFTPYTVVYPGFLYCRKAPSSTSEEVLLIRGNQLVIIEQNQDRNWLFVFVPDEKKSCWIYLDIPYLELTPNQITRVPTKIIVLTLELPPAKP